MELMVLNSNGEILITSIGFVPDDTQPMPDYYMALEDSEGYGVWTGQADQRRKRSWRSRASFATPPAALSVPFAMWCRVGAGGPPGRSGHWVLCAGALVIVLVVASGLYFINSIITPIKQIGAISKRDCAGGLRRGYKRPRRTKSGSCVIISTKWLPSWENRRR